MQKILSAVGGGVFAIAIVIYSTKFMWMGPLMGMMWDGETTFVCDANQTISMSGKTADIIGGPAILVEGNCTLECDDCNLKGEIGISAKGNGKITLKGGSVEGQESAFFLTSNASINVTSSTIKGVVGIDASESANSKIELQAVNVEAKEVAIDMGGNSKLDARGSNITSALALRVASNANATIRGGTLTGTTTSIDQKANAKVKFKDDTKVTGAINAKKPASIEGLAAPK